MDDFQFIIESPQNTQGHKKRPRLVTSCDNCRLKKIKCLQPSPETKCEACKTAKIPCRFRDRERYFAERSRAIAGPSAGSSYSDSQSHSEGTPSFEAFSLPSTSSGSPVSSSSDPRSSSHSPRPTGVVCADGDPNTRYSSYPSDPRHAVEAPLSRNAVSASLASYEQPLDYNLDIPSPRLYNSQHTIPRAYQHSTRTIHLFDQEHPQYPNTSLMPHFIQLFFEQMGNEFSFMVYDEVLGQFFQQTISPLLSNCIASLATRYSTLPELSVRGLQNVAEIYADNAKTILSSIAHLPTIETLQSLILLCWIEYKSNRIPGFRLYCQMAMRMGIDLGFSDQNTIQMNPSDRERNRMRATWSSIVQFHLTASSFRP